MASDVIKVGQYIVIQKQNYKKLHKFNKPNSSITLGRDSINLTGIEGCPFSSVFRMIPNSKKGREYRVELTDEVVELKNEIDIKSSGVDNRNIIDDGRSQKLSKEQIHQLTHGASKASDIVETLISNSNTFHNKTEYSQAKYLKKKERKYFEYLQILKPNLRVVAEVMYKLEPSKIQHLRVDTLSQIITMSNVHCEGNHLLYDSGSNGLMAAALLNAIGQNSNGILIHMHPGNMSQKQSLLAMNFSEEQMSRCISVNIYSALRQVYQGNDLNSKDLETSNNIEVDITRTVSDIVTETSEFKENPLKRKADDILEHNNKVSKQDHLPKESISPDNSNDTLPEPKKPKWHFDNIAAADILNQKMDSLVIVSKEDPKNIFMELLPFIKPSRPFVIYYTVAEPLQHLYLALKPLANVAALKLTCNWMRHYQVLPERTHPEVTMNGQSGFLLTGYVLQ